MGAWDESEKIARKQLNLSNDYQLGMASVEVSDVDLGYQDEIFDRCEDDIGLDFSPELFIEIMEKHITDVRLPAGMFLVKMLATGKPDVWGFIQQEKEEN